LDSATGTITYPNLSRPSNLSTIDILINNLYGDIGSVEVDYVKIAYGAFDPGESEPHIPDDILINFKADSEIGTAGNPRISYMSAAPAALRPEFKVVGDARTATSHALKISTNRDAPANVEWDDFAHVTEASFLLEPGSFNLPADGGYAIETRLKITAPMGGTGPNLDFMLDGSTTGAPSGTLWRTMLRFGSGPLVEDNIPGALNNNRKILPRP
jgi:hypothetical protein